MKQFETEKAAKRGNPSFVWRSGQERRFKMIQQAAGERINGVIFEDGCGVGEYLRHLAETASFAVGLDIEFDRVKEASVGNQAALLGVGEHLPLPVNHFDMILSHEVLEHVDNDHETVKEIFRVLKPGGRLVLFVPNRGYPFETHGIYRNGEYRFGNKLFVNYLPRKLRDRLAPHVRVYNQKDLNKLFAGLPVKFIQRTVIFGAYDNIINRFGALGEFLRWLMQSLEKTPLKVFGLSHFWVVEKTEVLPK
ncbi:MAG: class I SAM-dependent methyltransferase [Anaerolineaceae bacterium]|nr:class I SAM-dependent methyltransferase [Anaerolineaceae bacterium]